MESLRIMDLARAAFLFSHIWLASMLATPLMIAAAKAVDPSMRIGICAPCAAATAPNIAIKIAPVGRLA